MNNDDVKIGFTHQVVKKNKRLWINVVETGEDIYTPPDFLRNKIHQRSDLYQLCQMLNDGIDYIEAVTIFETGIRS